VPHPLSNLLLDSLKPSDKSGFASLLEPVPLPLGTRLHAAGEVPRYVHFITSGMASSVAETADGDGVEIAIAGREGLPESLNLIGPARGQVRCFMQAAGTGLRMDFRRFEQEFLRNPALRALVLQHVQYTALVTSQIAACNRIHNVEERLARWLLMVASRLATLEMDLTQEFLSEMLGTRRSTVTLAAGVLQRSGLIDYRRGHIRILDKSRLEDTACECFQITEKLFQSLYQ